MTTPQANRVPPQAAVDQAQANEGSGSDVVRAKAALRAIVRERLKRIGPEQRERDSVQACQRLAQQQVWRTASVLLCYAPRADELDVAPMVESALCSGKRVALPQFDPKTRAYRACEITRPLSEVALGTFGIREPGMHCATLPLNQLDLILVPGLAYDLSGRRLGRGRGYYDLLLNGLQAVKCGLAFDEQVLPEIPVERHDIFLDCILTPTRWVEFNPR